MRSQRRYQITSTARVIALGMALLSIAVAGFAFAPHGDGPSEDLDCLICKAGQKPLTELQAQAPSTRHETESASGFERSTPAVRILVVDPGSPRAPPI